ncbi:asialoglycoprotein receptor 1-like isoform X2 [Crotalus tigris]|nr:asialoglycoprotein receptor 1-like isoform X2 [Crotalus tigris]
MEASEPPTTAETYEDFPPGKEEEEYEKHFEKDFPLSKSFSRRVCPTNRLRLVLTVFCAVLILLVSILGMQGLWFTKTLQETQKGVQNVSQTIQQGVTQLKGKSQNTTSKLAALQKILQQEEDKWLNVLKLTQTQLETVEQNSRTLNCEIIEMKSNGSKSGCCPRGWLTFHSSCYWTTQSRTSWQGAKKDCEEKKSHLVIINSAEEKAFVKNNRRGDDTWIGLTDESGSWIWVDGSSYTIDPKDWAIGQPDHWYGHGLGGGEDCAHMTRGGQWNDNHCSRSFTWVCEMDLGI